MTKEYLQTANRYKKLMPKLYAKFTLCHKLGKVKYARSVLNRINFLMGVLKQLNQSSGGTEFLPYK